MRRTRSLASGSSVAIGIIPCGRVLLCRITSGSIRSRRLIPCSSPASTDTWRWPMPPRCARRRSRVRRATRSAEKSPATRALAHAASLGVTATGNMSASWANLAAYKRMERAGRMTVRFSLYLPIEDWRTVADSVRAHGAGDDWVRIGGVKGYMDGSAGSRTAFFFDSFSDSAGYSGLMRQPESNMRAWVGAADSAGLQVAVHAIGDRANAILLAIYD